VRFGESDIRPPHHEYLLSVGHDLEFIILLAIYKMKTW